MYNYVQSMTGKTRCKYFINNALQYIKRHADKPLHKIFNQTKLEYKEFLSDVLSDKPKYENFIFLAETMHAMRIKLLTDLYVSTYDFEEWHIYNEL